MNDSLSDFDQTLSNNHSSTETSEDLQIKAENPENQLQEIHENLLKENSILKAQFSEAIQCASKFDEMHEKITQLSTEINSISSERDDLSRRLEISLRANDELNHQIQSERVKFCEQRKDDNSSFKKQLEANQETMKKQIDSLYEQLEQLQALKESNDIELKIQTNIIQKILSSANHFFQCTFCKPEDLIQIFEQTTQNNINNIDIIEQPQKVKIEKDVPKKSEKNHKIKKLKIAIEESNKTRKNLENEILNMKKEIKEANFTSSQTIDELKKQIQQLNEDHSIAIEDYKHQISVLEGKVQTLKGDVQKRKEEQRKMILEHSQMKNQFDTPPKPAAHSATNELELANEQLQQRTEELDKKVKELNDKLSDSEDQLCELQSVVKSKDLMIDKLKHDFDSLNLVHQTTVDEIKALRNVLHMKTKKNPVEEDEKKQKIHALKAQILTLKKTSESQISQIRELSTINEQLSHTVEEQNSQITKIKFEKEANETRSKEISEELHSLQQEMSIKTCQSQPEPFPTTSLRFIEFDAPLKTEIERISLNQHLQPATKLQNIYKIINKYFSEQILDKDKICQNALSENQLMKDTFNQFFADVSIALSQKPCSLDDFFAKDGCKVLAENILAFRGQYDELKRRFDVNDAIIKHLVKTMNFEEKEEAAGLVTEINELEAKFSIMRSTLAKRKKRISILKTKLAQFKEETERNAIEIKCQNDHLKEKVGSLTKMNKDLSANNLELKRQVHQQKLQIEDCNIAQQDLENKFKCEKETILKEKEESEKNLSNQIAELAGRLKSSEEHETNCEIAINKLKKIVANMKNTISEKSDKLQNTRNEYEAKITDLTEKWQNEKQQIVQSYENAISEMKKETEEQRKDVEKLVHDLNESKRKTKKFKELSNNLKIEKSDLEKEIENIKIQNLKNKQILELNTKNQLDSNEKDFLAKIENFRIKSENEKRRLFTFIADQFRQFFNPQDTIDESTAKAIITRASAELSRLISSDFAIRKMVGAEIQQRTDDAVAQLVTCC